ncbi:hypothetical protein [Trichothermofontia sp.]
MATARLVLIVGTVGMLGIVVAQNVAVSLRLVVLGQPTIALPLGVWVVLAGLAGAGTTAVLTALFRWSNYLTRQAIKRALRTDALGGPSPASPSPATATSPPSSRHDATGETCREQRRPSWPCSTPPMPSPSPMGLPTPTAAPFSPQATSVQASTNTTEVWDDWAGDDRDRDWEDTPPPPTTASTQSFPRPDPSRPEDRRETPPTASHRSSVYSYSAQQLGNPAVGRSEAIYDAEYRVIIPPYRPLTEDSLSDADYDADYDADDSADDIDNLSDAYDEADLETEADFEDTDVEEELGDEVFEDWEEETDISDWPRR